MATGLLPARRVGGMAAMAASPDARPSSDIGAITSISGSSPPRRSADRHRQRAGRRQVGVEQRLVPLGAGHLVRVDVQHRLLAVGRAATARARIGRCAVGASGWRGALRRDIQVL